MTLLSVRLHRCGRTGDRAQPIVRDVVELAPESWRGRWSGSGKSMTALSVMGLHYASGSCLRSHRMVGSDRSISPVGNWSTSGAPASA